MNATTATALEAQADTIAKRACQRLFSDSSTAKAAVPNTATAELIQVRRLSVVLIRKPRIPCVVAC